MSNLDLDLQEFVNYCQQFITGDERGEAHIFLDRLFVALGYKNGIKQIGSAETRIKFTLDENSPTKFADLVIPGLALFEMKKRGVNLRTTQQQVLDYWKYLTPHPQYTVTCNFDEIWVYDMERQVDAPMTKFTVKSLAEPFAWRPLAFLLPKRQKPVFKKEYDLATMTEEASYSLSSVFTSLRKRGIQREHAQRFTLQLLIALFSEDIALLPSGLISGIIEECLNNPDENTSDELMTLLFSMMNSKGAKYHRWAEVPYFNGGIFSEIYPIFLNRLELQSLQQAAKHNWAKIRPSIFGTIFEQSITPEQRHEGGIHYTFEGDIQRIVDPVISKPWLDLIERADNVHALRALHKKLCEYTILDPACGSGNFLYMAYRELKRIEINILTKLRTFEPDYQPESYLSVKQFFGFDTNPFAVELAKVTLMIAKKLAVDEAHSFEPPLPLDNLDDNILCQDALFADWGNPDVIIGNPPYITGTDLKHELGESAVQKLREAYPEIEGRADYCVYWLRKAHDVMGTSTRAGFVCTNTIRDNASRRSGLDYITKDGYIFEAYQSMPWSGQAMVYVSIVCWSKQPLNKPARLWLHNLKKGDKGLFTLMSVPSINSSLSSTQDLSVANVLSCNTHPQRAFEGQKVPIPIFVISEEQRQNLIKQSPESKTVIRPFLTGDDLVGKPQSKPSRYVIDFRDRDVLEASVYTSAFAHVKKNAKTDQPRWWLHARRRPEMNRALNELKRYIACCNAANLLEQNERPIREGSQAAPMLPPRILLVSHNPVTDECAGSCR